MSIATHGGYDQVVEIDQTLLTSIARETFAPSSDTVPIVQPPAPQPPDFEASAAYNVRLHALWLGARNERWLPARLGADDAVLTDARWLANQGWDERPERNAATITLDLKLAITITRLKNLSGDLVRPIDVYCGQADPAERRECEAREDRQAQAQKLATIKFDGYVDVTGPLDTALMTVRTDRDRLALTERVWCAVLDLPGLPFPARIDVVIDEARVARALPIRLQAIAAGVAGGEPAAQQAIASTFTAIRQEVADAVRDKLADIHDWRHDANGRIVLHAATGMTPPVTRMGVTSLIRVNQARLGSSLLIGMQTQSSGGDVRAVQESQLGAGETMAVTISHAALVRDVLRPAMFSTFNGLGTSGALIASLARRWLLVTKREVTVFETAVVPPPPGTSTFTLTSLLVLVDNSERVRLLFGIRAPRYAGAVTAVASIDLHLGFSAAVRGAGAGQEVVITPSILNPATAVTSKRADVAPWVYLLAGGLGGIIGGPLGVALGLIVTGILDGTVLEVVASGTLAKKISESTPGSTANPLPADVQLASTGVSLFQADAAALTDQPWPLFDIRDHDLVLRFSHTLLPSALAVICQVRDAIDPDARIDGIGVVEASTTETTPRWRLPIDTAIQMIQAGTHTFVARAPSANPPVPDAPIVVVTGGPVAAALRPPHLRTLAEQPPLATDARNNLGNLLDCP